MFSSIVEYSIFQTKDNIIREHGIKLNNVTGIRVRFHSEFGRINIAAGMFRGRFITRGLKDFTRGFIHKRKDITVRPLCFIIYFLGVNAEIPSARFNLYFIAVKIREFIFRLIVSESHLG